MGASWGGSGGSPTKGKEGPLRRFAFLFLLFSLTALDGCLFREPFRIGFVGPMTGKFSDLGVHGRNGAFLAVEAVNAQGGVRGRPLELIPFDDHGTVAGAMDAARKLIQENVRVVVGPMTSTQTKAVIPVIEEVGGIVVSPTASSHEFDGAEDALFRLSPSDRSQVDVLARHMVLERRIHSLAIVWDQDNEAYAKGYAEAIAQAFLRRGGIVAAQRAFRSSAETPWDLIVLQIRHVGPDGVLVVASAKDTATLCQFLALQGVRIPVFSSFWARSPDLLLYGGHTVEGVEMVSAVDLNNPTPVMQQFMRLYYDRFGKDANHAAVFSYEAVLLLARALEHSHSQDLPLRTALITIGDLSGPTGPIRLDAYGDRILPCVIETVSEGRFITLAEGRERR